jgi:protein ImuB
VLLDDPVELFDAEGNPVRVTARGMFSAAPHRLDAPGRSGQLSWWTGPWSVDERWWDTSSADVRSGRTARAQVLLGSDRDRAPVQALLLCYRQRRWYVEGIYE